MNPDRLNSFALAYAPAVLAAVVELGPHLGGKSAQESPSGEHLTAAATPDGDYEFAANGSSALKVAATPSEVALDYKDNWNKGWPAPEAAATPADEEFKRLHPEWNCYFGRGEDYRPATPDAAATPLNVDICYTTGHSCGTDTVMVGHGPCAGKDGRCYIGELAAAKREIALLKKRVEFWKSAHEKVGDAYDKTLDTVAELRADAQKEGK
jgi:hypothetical protein